jgi:hypothetical protein
MCTTDYHAVKEGLLEPTVGQRVADLVNEHHGGVVLAAAKRAKIPPATLKRIIDGSIKNPRYSILKKLADAHPESARYLLLGKKEDAVDLDDEGFPVVPTRIEFETLVDRHIPSDDHARAVLKAFPLVPMRFASVLLSYAEADPSATTQAVRMVADAEYKLYVRLLRKAKSASGTPRLRAALPGAIEYTRHWTRKGLPRPTGSKAKTHVTREQKLAVVKKNP